ncbi:hypothetical protein HAX54_003711, partial [Datura stramonium]|nr:hypothetical protein [Datura stramonium]
TLKNFAHDYLRALRDNGASTILIPLPIYKLSRLAMLKPISIGLQLANKSIKKPVGAVEEVPEKFGTFILSAGFVVLDCGEDIHNQSYL